MIAFILFTLAHFVVIGDNKIKEFFKNKNNENGCVLPFLIAILIMIGIFVDIMIGI